MKRLLALSTALAGITSAAPLPLIPLPVSVKPQEGSFSFSPETAIRFDRSLKSEAALFAADLQARSGTAPKTVAEELHILLPSEIRLDLNAGLDLPPGGYELHITPKSISIVGKDPAGAYYGTRSVLQLLPALGDAAWKDAEAETVPAVEITDYPRYAWRGMMLDVCRHFVSPDDVKRFIDWMAFHKLNTFHWHLSDDQGWRIEIKKYPKLTEVGGWRDSTPPYGNRNSDDGKRYGGFYTQEQIKDIVSYAAARHVTVMPEIEMPGHAAAAITAYPELGNSDIRDYSPKVVTRWGVFPYIFSPKEETFTFLEDVLSEVCELFPSPYIHIGGDEAPKDQWKESKFAQEVIKREGLKNEEELQSWFIRRINTFLESKGRKLIGWDEIQEGGLPKTATMMVWRDVKWARHALEQGNHVVMAPNSELYLDKYQAPEKKELGKSVGLETIGGFLPIEKVYAYNPSAVAATPSQQKQILGTQAQLWAEYMHDFRKVEYMAFPRIAAVAEIAWTPLERKNFEDFSERLKQIEKQYAGGKLNYHQREEGSK